MISEARRLSLLLAGAASVLMLAYQAPSAVFFDFGPNDAAYLQGFREDFEIDEPTFIHWSGDRARVTLPLRIHGPYEVTLRDKRHVAAPADVRWYLEDELADRSQVPQQDFGMHRLDGPGTSGTPFELRLLATSSDPRPLGVALDWMSLRTKTGFGGVVPTAGALFWMLTWVAAFYAVPRALGLGTRVAWLSGGTAAATLALLAAVHKLWPIHVTLTLGIRAHVVAAVLVAIVLVRARRRDSAFADPLARWAAYVVYVGLAVRLFALFHPDFYYPDVRTHSKFVSLIWTEGLSGLFENYIDSQHRHLLGLQLIGDRWVAFPYPPLLYLSIYPLSLLRLPVEDWMRLVPTTLTAIEALVVYALARRLRVSAVAAFVAVILHASARVLAFRLAVASYAALFGHFWDTLAVAFLVLCFERIHRPAYALGFTFLILTSLLSYAGSALVLGIFVPTLCIAAARERSDELPVRRLMGVAALAFAAAMAALFGFYGQYLPEILPETSSAIVSGGLFDARFTPLAAASMAAYRLNLFYGAFGFLAVAVLFFRRKHAGSPLVVPLAVASLVTFAGLNVLRAGLGDTHIFQFTKDDLVVLPLIVVALGVLCDLLRSRPARALAIVLVSAWIAWGAYGLSLDVRGRFIRPEYPPRTSPVTRAPVPGPRA